MVSGRPLAPYQKVEGPLFGVRFEDSNVADGPLRDASATGYSRPRADLRPHPPVSPESTMMLYQHDKEWNALYLSLGEALSQFGREDAYGKGDFWLVDDDYGDTAHKVCVARRVFITPELIGALQRVLIQAPHWRVLLQIDEEVDGAPASSTGLTVRIDSVETSPKNGVSP